jgi:ABC-2 type transport system ATP-binding protein
MARRIGLAQALINDPDLLILDEPTSGLDPIGAKLVKDIILRLGRAFKKTILLSSHLLADVEEVCDRVTILYGGRIQESGKLEDILSRRDMLQITCERLGPETLDQLTQLIERREGKTVTVSTPRDRLESLFLRIVDRAREQRLETAGSAPVGAIAGFLGAEQEGQALIEKLVRTEPVAASPAPATAAGPSLAGMDAAILTDLVLQAPTAPVARSTAEPAAAPSPDVPRPPAGDIDRSMLDALTDESRDKDRP